ncbi:SDR family oxidoreductase [Rhodophyticola sp. CCM32]|uniref:SDR family NAD(P)-dependent oxidoreductase n=1 Tax=Rhodophyticola sp. CCM32 TaxID=2916397 RepID=UPI00107F9BC4|nr:SDR family oxidoreductase [Rhodophyticola sp. CCM32]QBX99887.1 SDR family oxidoreductase [Rhodophyticola sp. CCM32]
MAMQAHMPCALVTGGTRGLGAATALCLAKAGWSVIAVGRDLPADPPPHEAIRHARLDIAREADVATFMADLKAEGTRLTGLVNNAARQGGGPITGQSREDWQGFLDVNITGAWQMIKYALPLMTDGGSIVNTGSVASVAGFAERAAYCASKHALLGLTRALAVELAPRKIRVNHLVLGSFDTPGLQALAAANGKSVDAYSDRQLLGRLGTPEEAAQACLFLMSEQAGFVTGTSLTVDGGFLVKVAHEDTKSQT